MGCAEFDSFNQIVIEKSEEMKPHQSQIKKKNKDGNPAGLRKNKVTLKADATVADQEVIYPTDLKSLNECRENLERIIDLLYNPKADRVKPRTYRRVARKDYLNMEKKKNKSKKTIRKGIKNNCNMFFVI